MVKFETDSPQFGNETHAIITISIQASQGVQVAKNLLASTGDQETGSVPESERFPGGGNGASLQYSCLENSVDREAWQATVDTVDGVGKSRTQLSTHAFCNIMDLFCSFLKVSIKQIRLDVSWLLSFSFVCETHPCCCIKQYSFVSTVTTSS